MAVQTINQRPLLEAEQRPSVLKVAADYVQSPDGLNELVVEPVTATLRWSELAVTALSEIVKGPKEIFERLGHLLLWAELPSQMMKLGRSVVKLKDAVVARSLLLTADKSAKVYVNATFMTGLIADGAQILYHAGMLPLSPLALAVFEAFGLIGSVALLVKSVRGIIKNVQVLRAAELWTARFNLALIALASKITLLVVAVFSIAAFFYSIAPLTWIILIFSTILLILCLVEHFYEKTHFGEKAKASPAST
jgi:hypothetical protein